MITDHPMGLGLTDTSQHPMASQRSKRHAERRDFDLAISEFARIRQT